MSGPHHVTLGKIRTRSEAVHEVIGDGHPAHRIRQRLRAKDITHNQLYVAPPRSSLQSRGVARQTSHADTRFEQPRDKPPADVSGDTGHQHGSVVGLGVRKIHGAGWRLSPMAGSHLHAQEDGRPRRVIVCADGFAFS